MCFGSSRRATASPNFVDKWTNDCSTDWKFNRRIIERALKEVTQSSEIPTHHLHAIVPGWSSPEWYGWMDTMNPPSTAYYTGHTVTHHRWIWRNRNNHRKWMSSSHWPPPAWWCCWGDRKFQHCVGNNLLICSRHGTDTVTYNPPGWADGQPLSRYHVPNHHQRNSIAQELQDKATRGISRYGNSVATSSAKIPQNTIGCNHSLDT